MAQGHRRQRQHRNAEDAMADLKPAQKGLRLYLDSKICKIHSNNNTDLVVVLSFWLFLRPVSSVLLFLNDNIDPPPKQCLKHPLSESELKRPDSVFGQVLLDLHTARNEGSCFGSLCSVEPTISAAKSELFCSLEAST